ncbi:hypothetical protein CBQ26_00430 [Deinococcus indicus]|uniref:Uncharacterized protein n=1 Tax=Deinococcus indicus TaxID=223556 RepID=A0A246BTF1_9DEIO|nr:hypothetical protein [Deinococcus indicus]OWL98958.1 hypothetical protein CBQ26_00430 [Deinococcus indicus]
MPQTTRPAQQPTGQFVRLAPTLAYRALTAGAAVAVIHGNSRPGLTEPVLRFAALLDRYDTPIGYRLRLMRGESLLAEQDVLDRPAEYVGWYPNRGRETGAYVRTPDLDGLTAAARDLTRRAGSRA